MTIGLYKYYHLVHNIFSFRFFFHSMKMIYFQKIFFLKFSSIDFFLFSFFWLNDIYI